MGIFDLCGSVKKETHRKFEGWAQRLGKWRRLGVMLLGGVVRGGMTQVVRIGGGLTESGRTGQKQCCKILQRLSEAIKR